MEKEINVYEYINDRPIAFVIAVSVVKKLMFTGVHTFSLRHP